MGLTFIDLFCGIGTIRMGMEQAGHECVYSVEWDKHKRKIYSIIFGGEPEGADICTVNARELPKADVWTFGAPCQDFSIAGTRSGLEGDRSSLIREVFRLVRETKEEHRPKYLLYENVKGMLSSNKGFDYLEILSEMESLGYDIEWQLLNSKNFGVPHNRERVLTIGHLRGRSSEKVFPIEQTVDCKNPAVCLTARGYGSQRNGTYVVTHSKGIEVVGDLDIKGLDSIKRIYGVNGISPSLTTMQGGCRQPKIEINGQIRILTPKECWRLQGIPDQITDKVIQAGISDSQMYRGAGDACTVNVIYEIAKKLT
jgi:DNA (cytosine-5)-methyltransferase 1